MSTAFDVALVALRAWVGEQVVIVLEPEGTVMRGRLEEREADGIDGAVFALGGGQLTGVALALFRDGVRSAAVDEEGVVVEQGRVTVRVVRAA